MGVEHLGSLVPVANPGLDPLHSTNLQQMRQEYTIETRQSLQ